MKSLMAVCVAGSLWIFAASAQEPALRKGVSVEMATAEHAVEMRAADAADATVVAITAEGKIYANADAVEPAALSKLTAETVYLKADARAPFQKVLAVVDALRGKSVVLLAAPPPQSAPAGRLVPPYGLRMNVSR
jgi:biopolymer transport protein ExbD